MLNIKKTLKIDRLTPKQLKAVFNPPKRKSATEVLGEGLYNKKGEKILQDQIKRDKKKSRRVPLSEENRKRKKKLMEQKEKERKQLLWQDYWSTIARSKSPAAISLPTTIGSMIVGVSWRIWRP